MNKMKNDGFRKMLNEEFTKYTDLCIEDFISGNAKSLFSNVKSLSKVVLDNFKPMIPKSFQDLWKDGIESNTYYLKLCGSGGGGYILGFAPDYQKAQEDIKHLKF